MMLADAITRRVKRRILRTLASLNAEARDLYLQDAVEHLDILADYFRALLPSAELGPDTDGQLAGDDWAPPVGGDLRLDLGLTLDRPLSAADGWSADPRGAPVNGVDAYVGCSARLGMYRGAIVALFPQLWAARQCVESELAFEAQCLAPLLATAVDGAARTECPYVAETNVAVIQRLVRSAMERPDGDEQA